EFGLLDRHRYWAFWSFGILSRATISEFVRESAPIAGVGTGPARRSGNRRNRSRSAGSLIVQRKQPCTGCRLITLDIFREGPEKSRRLLRLRRCREDRSFVVTQQFGPLGEVSRVP